MLAVTACPNNSSSSGDTSTTSHHAIPSPGSKTRPRSQGCRTTLLLVVLAAGAALAHAVEGGSSTSAASAPAAAQCRIDIKGGSGAGAAGSISSASMACTGGQVTLSANEQLLKGFQGSFQGVSWDARCTNPACLISICADSRLVVSSSSITGVAVPGVGRVLCVSGRAELVLQDSSLLHNNATALAVTGAARVVVNGSRLVGNAAPWTPSDHAAVSNLTLDGRVILGQAALNASGGALVVAGSARVTITGRSEVSNNSCTAKTCLGGAVYASDNASVIVDGGSRVDNNTALFAGGGLAALGGSIVVVTDSSCVCGNRVLNGSGGGVFLAQHAQLNVTGASSVCNNSCPVGSAGGVLLQGQARMVLTERSMVCDNRACSTPPDGFPGGGIMAADHTLLLVTGRSGVYGNSAGVAGGGIVLVNGSRALITGRSFISNNTCVAAQVLSFGRGGAGLMLYGHASAVLRGRTVIAGNRAIDTSGGGVFLAGAGNLTVMPGVEFLNNSVSRGFAGFDIAAFERSTFDVARGALSNGEPLTKCSRSVFLGRVPCQVGEHGASGVCRCCPPFSFDLEGGDSDCLQCPPDAVCPGGSEILPMPGYWHSSPRSVQIHQCPLFTAACDENRTCLAGYTGNLCGACTSGHGITTPLKCQRCLPPARQLGSYLAIVCVTVGVVAVTVRFAWQDNKQADKKLRPTDLIKVLIQFLQYLVILSSISAVPWPSFLITFYGAATVVFGAASGQALSLDCLLRHWGMSKERLPLAIQRQLVFFLAAFATYFGVALLLVAGHWAKQAWQASVRACAPQHTAPAAAAPQLWKRFDFTKLLVAIPVVLFFAYPTLVKAAMMFFACLRIDDANKPPYAEYAVVSHPAGYWVGDIQQPCFAGWHETWALGLGLPMVLLFCLFLPLGMLGFLWTNKHKSGDSAFRKYWGFLYRNYKDGQVWWEAVWAVQTVLLTAVSVFHFSLQAYNALLLMVLVLLASAVVQSMVKPYAEHRLHRLHLAATLCLIVNVWCALALFSCSGRTTTGCFPHWQTGIGAIMLALNASFVIWCMYDICVAAVPLLQSWGKSTQELVQATSHRLQRRKQQQQQRRRLDTRKQSLSGLWHQLQQRHALAAGVNGQHSETALAPVQSAPARLGGLGSRA